MDELWLSSFLDVLGIGRHLLRLMFVSDINIFFTSLLLFVGYSLKPVDAYSQSDSIFMSFLNFHMEHQVFLSPGDDEDEWWEDLVKKVQLGSVRATLGPWILDSFRGEANAKNTPPVNKLAA